MASKSDRNLVQALQASEALTHLADKCEEESVDDGCMLVYGVMRDCAYKIRAHAEREMQAHKLVRNVRLDQ